MRRPPSARLRRDHHRRQRPLGPAARPAGHRGAPRRRRRRQGTPARRGRARDRGADRLLLLDRELVAARGGGRGADGDVRRADRLARRPSSTRRACGCASSAAARASRRSWSSGWTGPRRRPPATSASPSSSPSTTAAGRRSSTRREASRASSRRSSARHLYAPEMHDPDLLIRTSGEQRHLQLPALAVRLLGAGLPRRALAGLRPRRASRSRWREFEIAPAALRSAGRDRTSSTTRCSRTEPPAAPKRPPRASRRARRGGRVQRRDARSGSWSRSPGSPSRSRSSSPAALVFALAMIGSASLCLREFLAMTEALRPIQRRRLRRRRRRWSSPPTSAPPSTCCWSSPPPSR